MSIQPTPDERDLRYIKLVDGRLRGLSEEEIVAGVKGCDSPRELYRQIKEDGHPICPVCGTTYVEEEHCKSIPRKSKRRARQGEGEAIELPPAADATELFNKALKVYAEDVAKLAFREEHLKDERFSATYVYPPETERRCIIFSREKMPNSSWEFYCSLYGKDPTATDEFEVYHTTYVGKGASQSPPGPLTRLIAMYILAELPLEPLIEKLHHAPESVNMEQLRLHINDVTTKNKRVGLMREAERVARVVRGATLQPGPNTGELSPLEHKAIEEIHKHRQNIERAKKVHHYRDPNKKVRYIKDLEKKMYKDLRQRYRLSKSEVDRLERLRVPSQRDDYRENAP